MEAGLFSIHTGGVYLQYKGNICNRAFKCGSELPEYVALILRNGGSQSPDRWLREPRNNQQDFDHRSTYALIQDYIEKTEEDSRPLLLFLFGFAPSVEIEGHLYSVNEKPHPIGPLRKACFKLFPELVQYLYDNDCIPDTEIKSLFQFLCSFSKN